MWIDNLITLPEEKEEKSLTDKFNTRLMCSLCNKHDIIINKEEKSFDISEQDLVNSTFIDYNQWWASYNTEWIRYKGLFYVISDLDDSNKYSLEYENCTSIIAVWKDRNTWKNISFLTHQHPDSVQWNMFKRDLVKSLYELKEKSVEWSIDIVILGWNNIENFDEYFSTIDELWFLIEEEIWINADIVWWYTNNDKESVNLTYDILNLPTTKEIYLNTEERRVYFYKHFLDQESNIDFKATEIDEVINKIENN